MLAEASLYKDQCIYQIIKSCELASYAEKAPTDIEITLGAFIAIEGAFVSTSTYIDKESCGKQKYSSCNL